MRDPYEELLWPHLLALAAEPDIVRPAYAESACSFWDLYAPVALGRGSGSFVIGQLGQSLDGRIATATGRSHYINGPEAIRHLHRLRALVDAVIVGVATVVADDPRLTARDVGGRQPARVVIDPNGRLPPDARMLANDGCPIFVIQGSNLPRPAWVTPITVPWRDGRLDPAAIVAALGDLGFRRLLVEGGAVTLSHFLAARALDRIHICVAPIVIGAGPIGINLPPIDQLDGAIRPQTAVHHLGRDIVFDCAFEPAEPPLRLPEVLLLDPLQR
jgi:riboflavin-specific deaminase-like protein